MLWQRRRSIASLRNAAMSKKNIIRSHYEPRVRGDRENYDVLDWSDSAGQRARFEALVRCVELTDRRLLDVGCGLGDLWDFLKGRNIPVDYTGVDIVEKMVYAARQMYPGARFECTDVFAPDSLPGRRFDVVFCSGVFNLDLGNNIEFVPRAAGRMLELADEAAVFNLLHHRAPSRYDHCFYYDPAEVVEAIAPLGCTIQIVDDYLPSDFTVICRRRG